MGEVTFEGDPPYELLLAKSGKSEPSRDGVVLTLNVAVDNCSQATRRRTSTLRNSSAISPDVTSPSSGRAIFVATLGPRSMRIRPRDDLWFTRYVLDFFLIFFSSLISAEHEISIAVLSALTFHKLVCLRYSCFSPFFPTLSCFFYRAVQ